jgi:PAS domain S-box-containing protein
MESRQSKRPEASPHILVFARTESERSQIAEHLREHLVLRSVKIDWVDSLRETSRKVAHASYDLLLGESGNPHAARIATLGKTRRIPVLWLPLSTPKSLVIPKCPERRETDKQALALILGAMGGPSHQHHAVADEALRTLYSAIDQSADLIVITDSRGAIEYVNPAFEKLTGYTRTEVIGQNPRILKSGEQPAELYRELWRTIRAGEIFRGVLVNRKKSGESFIVEKTITPVRNAAGEVSHFISNDRDISERRRLEAALFQAQKMDAIGQLAGGVAHDFNNLLLVINSYAELMLDSIGPEHRLHRNVQEVLKAARRAADLTRQLLAFGRKQPQSLQILDLNSVLRDISRMLPRLIGEDVELIISPEERLDKVKLDPVQVEQIVMNLAANARDAMPEGGKLTISTRNVELDGEYAARRPIMPSGRYVMLEVCDTGHGIDPEHLPHIFEPFYTTKDKGKGTGLGLATVYGIVKQSGGFIWVYSEPGLGTTFKAYFPRVEARATATALADTSQTAILRGSETLLLVEDESAVRSAACEFLRNCGYTVLEAKDALQGVELAHKHQGKIELMVTDVVMPGMSGGQLAELLIEKYPDMKVLFVSGYSEQVVLRHKIFDVQTNFLQKPFTMKSLGTKIRQVLGAASLAAGASR